MALVALPRFVTLDFLKIAVPELPATGTVLAVAVANPAGRGDWRTTSSRTKRLGCDPPIGTLLAAIS